MKNQFKAPQRKLQSSWVQLAFSKPKSTGTIIKRSLGNRPSIMMKSRGVSVSNSTDFSY